MDAISLENGFKFFKLQSTYLWRNITLNTLYAWNITVFTLRYMQICDIMLRNAKIGYYLM